MVNQNIFEEVTSADGFGHTQKGRDVGLAAFDYCLGSSDTCSTWGLF
jgi:hypothetical protein